MADKKTRNEEISELRKNQILDGAIKVFSKKGFEGSTTKEIAKEAGVSEGTIFRYFETKKDILLYMLDVFLKRNMYEFTNKIQNNNKDAKTSIKELLKEHFRLIMKNYDLIKILVHELQYHQDLKEKFQSDFLSKIIQYNEKVIKEIYPDKEIDPELVSRAFVGMFLGLTVLNDITKLNDKDLDENKLILDAIDVLADGIE